MNKSQVINVFTQAYNQGKLLFIFVYMNGCGHCETVKPIWDKVNKVIAHNSLYSNIKMIKIEQDDLKYLSEYIKPINSFPTFLSISKYNTSKIYNIDRDYKSIFQWVTKKYTKGGTKRRIKRKNKRTRRRININKN